MRPPRPLVLMLAITLAPACSAGTKSVGELEETGSGASGSGSGGPSDSGLSGGVSGDDAEGEAVGGFSHSGEAVAGGPGGEEEGGSADFPDLSQLDRSQDCILDTDGDCGYPAGPYGTEHGDVLPNFTAFDCDGNAVEFAELLNLRPDSGSYNRGVVINLVTGWSTPSADLSQTLVSKVAEYRLDEVEILDLVYEGSTQGAPANMAACQAIQANVGTSHPVWFVPSPGLVQAIKNPSNSMPYVYVADANANYRYNLEGGFSMASLDQLVSELVLWPYG